MELPQKTISAVETAAALVTASLEDRPDRELIEQLIQEAEAGGWLHDLTAALAFGFASNVEAIGKLVRQDPRELWQRWCAREAQRMSTGRPFGRPE